MVHGSTETCCGAADQQYRHEHRARSDDSAFLRVGGKADKSGGQDCRQYSCQANNGTTKDDRTQVYASNSLTEDDLFLPPISGSGMASWRANGLNDSSFRNDVAAGLRHEARLGRR